MIPEFVAFDLETTGLAVKTDRIIELGAVRFTPDGTVLGELELLVDPGMPIPLAIQRLVGLTDHDVAGHPEPAEAVAQLIDFSEGATLVAHGATFDLAYCSTAVPGFDKREAIDTLELARILLPAAGSHSLPLLAQELSLLHERPHRAMSDADATRELFVRLAAIAAELPAVTLSFLRDITRGGPAMVKRFFDVVVEGNGNHATPAVRGGAVPPPRALRTPQPLRGIGTAAAELLGPGGPFAGEGYEHRPSQLAMAEAVGQTLERNGRLMIEAGTGVGKSFAYLVPLALWTERTGDRAVVATHTITLQEQLARNDVPRVNEALAEPVQTAVLKGRSNYVSLRRWERFLASMGDSEDEIRFAARIAVWLAHTETGDRAELRLASVEEPLWSRIASDQLDCLGSACGNWGSGRCHMVAARRAAAAADIVITNHALLLADTERQGTVLENYGALVIDEAHHLEESATAQLGIRLRGSDVAHVIERARHASGGALSDILNSVDHEAGRLFGDVKGFIAGALGGAGSGSVAWTDELRADHSGEVLRRAAEALRSAIAAAEHALDDVIASAAAQGHPDEAAELELTRIALGEIAAGVSAVLGPSREGWVAWLELRAEQSELRAAPTSVADTLHNELFARSGATVLTSATLSVNGDFGFLRERIGFSGAEEVAVASPFDYLSQALSVIPTDIPDYADDRYDEALSRLIADVAIRLEGRTLALFTGYSALRRAHGLLERRLQQHRIAVLGQGIDGTRRQVLDSFLKSPRTVLLGTTSFWEGIDVPGDQLSCIVVAKLPFAVPTDPLVRARSDHLSDPFAQYVLPLAVLRLRQGFGRLIRRTTDRGAVVLCDSRLSTRDYATAFLDALPPAARILLPSADVGSLVGEFVKTGAMPEGAFRGAQAGAAQRESREGADAPHPEDPA